jgi:hypothetical protein
MEKWLEAALDRLDPDDVDERNYFVRCDGKRGYLVLSQRKLIFVEEKGFLKKTYNVILDLPYEHIDRVAGESYYTLFFEAENNRHIVKTDVSVLKIVTEIRELKAAHVLPKSTPIVTLAS